MAACFLRINADEADAASPISDCFEAESASRRLDCGSGAIFLAFQSRALQKTIGDLARSSAKDGARAATSA
ncbi:MAG: hypothetical protein AAFR32_11090, partial [Pseudomonadota bacterium]